MLTLQSAKGKTGLFITEADWGMTDRRVVKAIRTIRERQIGSKTKKINFQSKAGNSQRRLI